MFFPLFSYERNCVVWTLGIRRPAPKGSVFNPIDTGLYFQISIQIQDGFIVCDAISAFIGII
jgi:hypothetical protein